MSETIPVAFCTDGIFPLTVGGMQRHSRLLIEELGSDPTLRLDVIHPHPTTLFAHLASVYEHRLPGIDLRRTYLLECHRYSRRILDLLRQWPAHVVYSQGLSVWAGIESLPNPIAVNPHGLESWQGLTLRDWLVGIPFRAIFRRIFRRADRVISLGGRLTTILRHELPEARIRVIPNAVNPPPFRPRHFHTPLRFLFVGRFAPNKGIHLLLRVAEELNTAGYADKFTFNLVGLGPLHEHFIAANRLPNVNFLGAVSDKELPGVYAANDAFVLPTLFEGMPTVVLEAMSHGLPVIVSDTGATAELVDDLNGYLIPRNDVAALTSALLDFHALPTTAKERLSVGSYEKVNRRFTWREVASMHRRLFVELAQSAPQGRTGEVESTVA